MHGIADLGVECWRTGFYGVDASGREWRVDTWAWRPLTDWDVQVFFSTRWKAMPEEQRAATLHHLYLLAEKDRGIAVARGGPRPPSPLGPLTAPQLWMFPRVTAVSPSSYRGFRVYNEVWLSRDKLAGHPDKRTLLGEYVVR
jgi:hypothetical protein